MPGFGLDLNSCFVNSSVWVSIDPFRLSRYDQDLDWGGGLKVVIIIGYLKWDTEYLLLFYVSGI